MSPVSRQQSGARASRPLWPLKPLRRLLSSPPPDRSNGQSGQDGRAPALMLATLAGRIHRGNGHCPTAIGEDRTPGAP